MLTKNTRFPRTGALPIVGFIDPALNTFVLIRLWSRILTSGLGDLRSSQNHLSLFGILALPCLLPIRG